MLVVEPVVQLEPRGQSEHCDAAARPVLPEKVPAKHGSSADAPRGQKWPRPQPSHAVDPLASWKLPAAHAVHSDCRSTAVYVPGEHGELVVEPTPQALPRGQAEHSTALCTFRASEYVPAKHGSSADAPSGQKLPPRQGLHSVAPSLFWYVPARHLVHVPAFAMSLYVPAAQSEALVEPVGLYEPGPVPVQSAAEARSVRSL